MLAKEAKREIKIPRTRIWLLFQMNNISFRIGFEAKPAGKALSRSTILCSVADCQQTVSGLLQFWEYFL
jgi:hypothetical protein